MYDDNTARVPACIAACKALMLQHGAHVHECVLVGYWNPTCVSQQGIYWFLDTIHSLTGPAESAGSLPVRRTAWLNSWLASSFHGMGGMPEWHWQRHCAGKKGEQGLLGHYHECHLPFWQTKGISIHALATPVPHRLGVQLAGPC